MDYQTLDKVTQANAIKDRIRDLERQHLQISLRVNAPDLSAPVNEMDRGNMELLESSLDTLNTMLRDLQAAPAPAAASPAQQQ